MRTTWLLLAVSVIALASRMEADTIAPPCMTGTLQSYEDNTGGCELGGQNGGILVFSGFSFPTPVTSGNPTVLNASQIIVSPEPSGLGGGFEFGGFTAAPVLAGQTAVYHINYSYFIDAGPISSGADMGMDPPFGNVSILEAICADSYFLESGQGCTVPGGASPRLQSFSVNDSNPPASWFNHLNLNPVVTSFANIETTITLIGGTTGAGFDGVSATSTVVSPTPEPMTILTTLGGLLLIGYLRLTGSLRRSECG